MALATTWSTANTAGIDLTAIWAAAANAAGTWGENVQPYPPFDVGMVVYMLNGGAAVYVKLGTGGATGIGYEIVVPLGNYSAAVMMSNSVGALGDKVGIWLGNGAGLIGDYGFIQVYGYNPTAQIASGSLAASTALASTTTAGQLSTATGTGTKNIAGIQLTATGPSSAGSGTMQLNWPTVGSTN